MSVEKSKKCSCGKPECYFCNLRKVSPWAAPGLELKTPEHVFYAICAKTGADPDDIISGGRKREYAIRRQVYCSIARETTKSSLRKIGEVVGYDHSEVLYSCRKVKHDLDANDPIMREVYDKVKYLLINHKNKEEQWR